MIVRSGVRPTPVTPVAIVEGYVEVKDDARPAAKRWPVAKGNPPSVENRHPSELNLDDSYQRSTDNGAVIVFIALRDMSKQWDWVLHKQAEQRASRCDGGLK